MNNELKLCVCTFHNGFSPSDICGVSSAPIYLADQLKRCFSNVDLITLRENKKYLSPFAKDVRYASDPAVLEDYDFVIFTVPGLSYEKYDENNPDKYIDVLNHAKRFTFICNDENDRKIYPYYMNFLSHPNISFVTFNCPTMATNTFTEYVDIVGDWDYVSFSPILPSKEEILQKAKQKKDKIMSTCRWTTSKRIYEYLSLAQEFKEYGIDVYTAGAHSSYWYNLKMEELPTEFYTDLGYFEPSNIPELLSDVKYHWNFLFQLRSMGRKTHQPRIEIATLEALREGCLPIICEEFTPDWVGKDSALRISKNDYKSIPYLLSKLSDEERFDRISKFYDIVVEHLDIRYKEFSKHIEDAVR